MLENKNSDMNVNHHNNHTLISYRWWSMIESFTLLIFFSTIYQFATQISFKWIIHSLFVLRGTNWTFFCSIIWCITLSASLYRVWNFRPSITIVLFYWNYVMVNGKSTAHISWGEEILNFLQLSIEICGRLYLLGIITRIYL